MQVSSSSFHNIDIICFSLSRWDSPVSSPAVSMAKEFAKEHRVFFIEHPYSYKDYLKERKGSNIYKEGNVTIITPPLVYPINFLSEGKLYDHLSGINNNILLKPLKKIIRQNNISRYIFINFFNPFFLQKRPFSINPEKYIYQCMDDISQVKYTRKHGLRLEEEIIARADYTLCTSHELTRLKSPLSERVFFHPNAADTALFNKAADKLFERPADMNYPDRKIIGFTGSIEYRTDFELLKQIALSHKDKIIYLIGPVYGEEHIDAGLLSIPNITFAGPRDIDKLPAYLQYFDCAIIPYKKTILTRSIYPLKINEYLAAGLPVVTTDFSEDIYSFHANAYVVESREAFIEAIDIAINEDNEQKKQQRLAAAALNSWTKRVSEFWDIISK
ncbi:MAG: glycosyltransferase [Chitinophagaceae bacterium]|nr:glycosyltransferase [Chitinophagaceae bacterium]